MNKRTLLFLFLAIVMALPCFGGSPVLASGSQRGWQDFVGESASVMTGTIFDGLLQNNFSPAETLYFEDYVAAIEAVHAGKAYFSIADELIAKKVLQDERYSDLEALPVPRDMFDSPIGAMSGRQDIIDAYNAFLTEITADGTLAEMQDRWLYSAGDPVLPDIPLTGENGMLVVATDGTSPLWSYRGGDGELMGFEIENMRRFARYLGMDVRFETMAFAGLIPYVVSGKADIGAGDITITEERRKSVMFTEPYFNSGALIVTRRSGDSSGAQRDWQDFVGKNASVMTGSIYDGIVQNNFSPAEILYFDDHVTPVEAVRAGKAYFSVMDALIAEKLLQDELYSDLETIPVPSEMFYAPTGAISGRQDIIDVYNAFLAEIEADGTLAEMQDRWLHAAGDPVLPDIPLTGENGTLVVATTGESPLWSYIGNNGEITGFDIENMRRFARYLGKDVRFEAMAFGGLIPYVVSGKADIGAANITLTEERRKSVLFTDPYFYSSAHIVTRKLAASSSAPKAIEDYAGAKIGVELGDTFDAVAEQLGAGEIISYATQADMLAALDAGKVDAVILANTVLPQVESLSAYSLDFLEIPETYYAQYLSPIFHDEALRDKYNEWVALIKADGSLDLMSDFWFDRTGLPAEADIPHQVLQPVNGTLNVCDTGNFPPLVYIADDGKVEGFDIDMIERFAKYLGMDLNITTMGYDAIEPYVVSGSADMSACLLAKTPEREKNMIFGDTLLTSHAYLIVKSGSDSPMPQGSYEDNAGFIAWLKNGVQNNLVQENRWKLIASGLGVTLTISVLALILGTLLGCFVCFLLVRKTKWARIPANVYNAIIHGLPIVVLLMVFYYIVFGKSSISSVLVAVVAFALVQGANVGGSLKNAIDTVDPVQIEAARSIGFTAFGAFRRVTLPQALKVALPGYLNGFVELVKSTAIVGYIAIQDLSRAGDIIRSRTYDAYFPILFVALVYLAITLIMVAVFKLIIRRITK
ncbi:MAG: ABC transporter permease subunit [Gracilibacteraceae bacterium]|nr:ABC transporter permease subunit [Gracilibacteraceae bacterium]